MTTPLLIGRTPRAGGLNHVNLLPKHGVEPGEEEAVCAYLDRPANDEGDDFISVGHDVEQTSGSGRSGSERLVLVRADIKGMERDRKENLKTEMWSRLRDLDEVIREYPWGEDRALAVRLPQLDKWGKEMTKKFPIRASGRGRHWRWIGTILFVAFSAILLIFLAMLASQKTGNDALPAKAKNAPESSPVISFLRKRFDPDEKGKWDADTTSERLGINEDMLKEGKIAALSQNADEAARARAIHDALGSEELQDDQRWLLLQAAVISKPPNELIDRLDPYFSQCKTAKELLEKVVELKSLAFDIQESFGEYLKVWEEFKAKEYVERMTKETKNGRLKGYEKEPYYTRAQDLRKHTFASGTKNVPFLDEQEAKKILGTIESAQLFFEKVNIDKVNPSWDEDVSLDDKGDWNKELRKRLNLALEKIQERVPKKPPQKR